MNATTRTAKSTAKTTDTGDTSGKFTREELAAMKERAKELKASARRESDAAEGERDVLSDRVLAERIHAIVKASAPGLTSKTYYGMPAYAKDGKVVAFFKAADKFKQRYATFGFEEAAHLDDGTMWPTSWALTKLTPADETKIGELVKKAASEG
jgi:uncharacterized protein YdhG (YjbR/CyaY superfamily)